METRISRSAIGARFALLLAFVLGGCATTQVKLYSGPALSEQQVATVGKDMPVVIKAVDGKAVEQGASDIELQLLPGRHQVQFGFTHEICFDLETMMRDRRCKRFDLGDFVLTFDAKAGHHYQIAVNSWMAGWQPYIIDKASENSSDANGKESFFLSQEVSRTPKPMPDVQPSRPLPYHD